MPVCPMSRESVTTKAFFVTYLLKLSHKTSGPGTNSRLLVTRAGSLGSASARRLSLFRCEFAIS